MSAIAAGRDDVAEADEPWPLPEGWEWSTLGSTVELNPATPFEHLSDDTEIPFIPMAAVSEESGVIKMSQRRPVNEVRKGYVRFREGDVIFAKITPCMENGKTAPVTGVEGGYAAGSTEFHVLRPRCLELRYLWYWLVRRAFRADARNNMSGSAGQLRVPLNYLRSRPIPIAPVSEQRRIVARIDELFTEVAEGETVLERARKGLDNWRRAFLKAAITGELTRGWREVNRSAEDGFALLDRVNQSRKLDWQTSSRGNRRYREPDRLQKSALADLPAGWTWASVDELTRGDRISAYGVLQPGPEIEGGVPMVRVGDINYGRVRLTSLKRIAPELAEEFARTRLSGRELLITLVGAIGRTAIAPDELAGANTARAVGVVPLSNLVNEHWVELWFRSPAKQIEMVGKAHEVARKTLNLEDVRSAAVALPPRDEQDEIVRIGKHEGPVDLRPTHQPAVHPKGAADGPRRSR